jgi:UDP-glucuronate 4-epimerase
LIGFLNILEACRHGGIEHLIYASSSGVYGGNQKTPFSEEHSVDHPVSLYAATKKANELMAHSYSHLYGLPTTGLRFFTVYGPWGRPDMAPYIFAQSIFENRPINIFNSGKMQRDFTYIDDVVEGILRVIDKPAAPDPDYDPLEPTPEASNAPWRIFNIGNQRPIELLEFIGIMENIIGRKAIKILKPMQDGDVVSTFANTKKFISWTNFTPETSIEHGLEKFITWMRDYHKY